MQIFGDPSRIPIVIVEHVNAPLRPTSGNSYLSHLEQKDADILLPVMVDSKAIKKSSDACPQQNGRSLKIVVFVHGFQACKQYHPTHCIKFCEIFYQNKQMTFSDHAQNTMSRDII